MTERAIIEDTFHTLSDGTVCSAILLEQGEEGNSTVVYRAICPSGSLQEDSREGEVQRRDLAMAVAASLLNWWARECHRLTIESPGDHSDSGKTFYLYDKGRSGTRYDGVSIREADDSRSQGIWIDKPVLESMISMSASRDLWLEKLPSRYEVRVGLKGKESAEAPPHPTATLRVLCWPRTSLGYFTYLASNAQIDSDEQRPEVVTTDTTSPTTACNPQTEEATGSKLEDKGDSG